MADNLDEVFPVPDALMDSEAEPAPVEQPVQDKPQGEPDPVEQPAAEPTPEPEPRQDDQRHVPLSVLMEERDRRKEVERRMAELEASRAQPVTPPNPYDDPEGHAAYTDQRVEQRLAQERFAMSDVFARQTHGAETVEKAVEWATQRAQADPTFVAGYMRQANPVDWIVQQHKRDAMLSEIGDRSMDDFVREYITKNPGLLPQSASPVAAPVAAAQQPASPPVRVPRSLATLGSGPSDVRDTATGPLAGVDALFS